MLKFAAAGMASSVVATEFIGGFNDLIGAARAPFGQKRRGFEVGGPDRRYGRQYGGVKHTQRLGYADQYDSPYNKRLLGQGTHADVRGFFSGKPVGHSHSHHTLEPYSVPKGPKFVSKKVSHKRSYGGRVGLVHPRKQRVAKVSHSRSYSSGRSLSPKLGHGVAKVAKVSHSRSYSKGRSLSPYSAGVAKHSRSFSTKNIVKSPRIIKSHILPKSKHGVAIGVSKGLSRSYKKIGHGGHSHGSYGWHDHAHGDYGHTHLDHDHDHGHVHTHLDHDHDHGHVHSHGVAKVSHSRSYSKSSPKVVKKSYGVKKVSHSHGVSKLGLLGLAKTKKAIRPVKVVADYDYSTKTKKVIRPVKVIADYDYSSDSSDDALVVVKGHSHGLSHVHNHNIGPHEHGHYGLHDHAYGEHDHTHAKDGSIIYKTGIVKQPYATKSSKRKPVTYQCRSKLCASKTGTVQKVAVPVKARSY